MDQSEPINSERWLSNAATFQAGKNCTLTQLRDDGRVVTHEVVLCDYHSTAEYFVRPSPVWTVRYTLHAAGLPRYADNDVTID